MSKPSTLPGNLIQRFLGTLRFPQLFVVAALLFAIDMVLPDAIPFLEELMLAVLTVLLSQWKKPQRGGAEAQTSAAGAERTGAPKPPPKNVTPPDARREHEHP